MRIVGYGVGELVGLLAGSGDGCDVGSAVCGVAVGCRVGVCIE